MIRGLVQVRTLAILVSFAAVAADDVQGNRDVKPVERRTVTLIFLREGETRSLQPKSGLRITRIDRFDPKLLQVTAIKADTVSLAGQSDGYTHMLVTDEKDQKEELFVVVEAKRAVK